MLEMNKLRHRGGLVSWDYEPRPAGPGVSTLDLSALSHLNEFKNDSSNLKHLNCDFRSIILHLKFVQLLMFKEVIIRMSQAGAIKIFCSLFLKFNLSS